MDGQLEVPSVSNKRAAPGYHALGVEAHRLSMGHINAPVEYGSRAHGAAWADDEIWLTKSGRQYPNVI